MNYLAHAFVALAESSDPALVLGSMLPDFAGMARARLVQQPEPAVRRGVELHHRADEAFHDDPRFLALTTQVTSALSARGVERGPARAVGHIGVELLLDGELVGDARVRAAYMGALNAAPAFALPAADAVQGERIRALLVRLCDHGPPWDYGRAEGVTQRLFMALSGRPRLRPRPGDAAAITDVLTATQTHVRACTGALLASVTRASLAAG